jgi:hypothetical protein
MTQSAALVAGTTYFITRFAISKLWDQREMEQARRVEIACLKAESKARWVKNEIAVAENSRLLKLLSLEIEGL